MKLVISLGNPDKEYDGTRHNVGFSILDEFASSHGVTFQTRAKFKAHIAEANIDGEKVLIAKPTTFYNLVGESLRAICDFYKIEARSILVVHDDLALPFGTLRIREGGSDAGNKGIKSISQHGDGATTRLRVGIANEQRSLIDDADFVLARFTPEESESLREKIIPKSIETILDFINNSHSVTSHRLIEK